MDQTSTSLPPIPTRHWQLSAVAGAGAFLAMLDSTVVNLAVESIRMDFGSTLSTVQWIVTGYLCALAVSLPAAAWLGKRFGYGRLWAACLALFIAASVLCALASDALTLIAARVFQGLAGGVMVPAGQAIIGANVEKRQLGRIMGVLGLVIALGPALGPALGGVLLDLGSWRWVFWINVPFGIVALLFARRVIPAGDKDRTQAFNLPGYALLGIGLPVFLYGAMNAGDSGMTMRNAVMTAAGLTLVVAFVLSSLGPRHALINIRLFRDRTFSSATLTTGLTGANMYGGLLLIPLYLQLSIGHSLIEAGMMLLIMGLGSAVALPAAGIIVDRYGARLVSAAGGLLLLASTIPFLLPYKYSVSILAVILMVRGVGLALAQMPAMTAAYTAVSGTEMGDATTLVNIVQRIGGALGAILVVVALQHAGDVAAGNYPDAFLIVSACSFLTIFTAMGIRSAIMPAPVTDSKR